MKKIIIISGAITILLILLGVWVYLLLFNQPSEEDGVFSNFNLFADQPITQVDVASENEPAEDVVINVGEGRLRQLTTRPVIGFTEVFSTSTEPYFVTYIEAGTGHIYQINLETGEEDRISNTTIPNASQAVIANNGQTAAIRSGTTVSNNVVYGSLNESGGLNNRPLPNTVYDMAFTDAGDLLYTEPTNSGVRARRLDVAEQSISTLFEVPFREAEIIWSTDGTTPHYVYTKPAAELTGYVYQVENGELVRLPMSGRGMAAIGNNNFVAYHALTEAGTEGFSYSQSANQFEPTPIIPVPEKCAFSDPNSGLLFCGFSITTYDENFPDNWYKGVTGYADSIWFINLENSTAQQIINPLQVTGREVDVTYMTASANTPMLYFINKNDQTLWSYER